VYRRYHDYVWLTLQRMGVRRADLHDTAHEVFLVVHRKLDRYDPEARLSAWLYGICLRVASAYRRKAYRRYERLEVPSAANPLDNAASSELADTRTLAREREALLERLLGALDPEQRAVLVMFEIEELSCEEIAAWTGTPLGTVYSRLARARKKLLKQAQRLDLQQRQAPRSQR
jgi:RNA polymerase sigma-70 factor (ECF subfamily)